MSAPAKRLTKGQSGSRALRCFNLFAGAGGLALGVSKAGFQVTDLFELNPHACETLRINAGKTIYGQIHQLDVRTVKWAEFDSRVDLLATGAPCQAFSLSGKHRAHTDDRNLFPEVIRAIRSARPAAVLLENVRGLLRPSFQQYFEYILRQLQCPSIAQRRGEAWQSHSERIRRHQCSVGYREEYRVEWRLLDAADYGVPQNRQRVFIVAVREDLPVYRFPKPTHSKEALLWDQATEAYWQRHLISPPPGWKPARLSKPTEGRDAWVTVRDALAGLPEPAQCDRDAWNNHWLIPGARSYKGHSGSVLDWPSKTIKAGVHGVPGGENTVVLPNGTLRYFTLREAARIQSFPDDHVFAGARIHVTRQIGNAVPVTLAQKVAQPLWEILLGAAGVRGSEFNARTRTRA